MGVLAYMLKPRLCHIYLAAILIIGLACYSRLSAQISAMKLLLQMGSPFEYRETEMQWVGRDGYMLWRVEFNSMEVFTIHPTEIFVTMHGKIAGTNPGTILAEQHSRTKRNTYRVPSPAAE